MVTLFHSTFFSLINWLNVSNWLDPVANIIFACPCCEILSLISFAANLPAALPNPRELGKAAGKLAAKLIRDSISQHGQANIILATGSSQFETLSQLINEKNVEWNKVTMFHLDEYIGLPISHKASFRKYLKERVLDKVPNLKSVNLINGEADPDEECKRLSELIK